MPKKGYRWSEERKQEWMGSESYQKVIESLCRPKSESHRKAMSEAKLGVAKSDEHRESMSRAHRRRWAKYNAIKAENPELESREIWDLVKESS